MDVKTYTTKRNIEIEDIRDDGIEDCVPGIDLSVFDTYLEPENICDF